MVCQDIYPISVWSTDFNQFLNRMYLFCDPQDSKTYKQSYLYSVIDGSSIMGEPIKYDFTTLNGRSRGVLVPQSSTFGTVFYLVQYDDSLWNSDQSTVNLRAFDLQSNMTANSFLGAKSYKFDQMSVVYKLLPRGNNVLLYGVLKKDGDKKDGKQVLLECAFDLQNGFSSCDNIISFHDSSIYLDFDSNGKHLDVYLGDDGSYLATVYQMDFTKAATMGASATPGPDQVSSKINFQFDSQSMAALLKDNYIESFDASSLSLRLRFYKKTTNLFAGDQVNYNIALGNGPNGSEKYGYLSSDPVIVQDNWVYSMNDKFIARFNNLPSYLLINPTDYTPGQFKATAKQGTSSADVKINYGSQDAPMNVSPALPQVPDIITSRNSDQGFFLPRTNIKGNSLKFAIQSTLPKEIKTGINSVQSFFLNLLDPTPTSWTNQFTKGAGTLALVHGQNGSKLSFFFCPGSVTPASYTCFGVVTTDVPSHPDVDQYLLSKPLTTSSG